jgi:AraC-like DNA-binding protein
VHDLQKQIESLQEPLNEISSSNRLDENQKDKIRVAIWRVNTMQNTISNILSLEKDSNWQKNLQSINGPENDKPAKDSFNPELESDDLYQSNIGKVSVTDQSFLEKVFSIIRKHFDEPDFNVDVLSKHMGMSRSSFYNKIKVISGQAPADFIRQYRLERAKELLKQKKYTVAEVALNTGFSDVKYFRDVFRKKYKRSPSQYMKLN